MKETQLIGPLTDQVDELQFILNHELEKMMQSIKQDVWSDEKEGISKNSPEGSTIQMIRSIHDNRQRAISEAHFRGPEGCRPFIAIDDRRIACLAQRNCGTEKSGSTVAN
jgi:hypothetical protein